MLKKLCCDLKIINCASRAIICLDAMKKFLCATLVFFVLIKLVIMCKALKA